MTDPLAAALDRLWRTNGPELRARAERVLAALADPGGDRADAVRDAHVLAGALGTYGRAGSELFAAAEALLEREPAGDHAAACRALADDVRRLLSDLAWETPLAP